MRWLATLLLLGPSAPASLPTGPVQVCRITDPAVVEVSGLVVTADGYLVENDSGPDPADTRLFWLDRTCKVTRSLGYPRTARDPEDLAVAADGTVWVADIGDNSPLTGGSGTRRSTIALWTLQPGAKSLKIHRLVYPDGVPRDAEALMIDGKGRPVIVTKDPGGEVFRLDGPLPTDNTTGAPLTKIGQFTPTHSGTANPWGFIGAGFVTGAAVAPDGRHAVVRTYADAYEFAVTDGDVAKAITTGEPAVVPLPDEPQGEAVAYTADGLSLLTVSDQHGPAWILRYTSSLHQGTTPAPAPGGASGTHQPAAGNRQPLLLAGLIAVAVLLVVVYVRRRRST